MQQSVNVKHDPTGKAEDIVKNMLKVEDFKLPPQYAGKKLHYT